MRKIVLKGESTRKEKFNRWIISIALLSIMVLSVFGIVMESLGKSEGSSSELEYKGVTFLNQNERWYFNKGGIDFTILNSPENLTNITISGSLNPLANYSQMPLYVYSEDKSLES